MIKKLGLAFVFLIIIGGFYFLGWGQFFRLDYLQTHLALYQIQYELNPLLIQGAFCLIYILVTATSLPGAALLTLLGGALFPIWLGFLLVSFSSTIGASLAFLTSRYLFRSVIEKKFKKPFDIINQAVEKEGSFYLLAMRLNPAFPFFVINLVMGLTRMRLVPYFFFSQLGMIPGTLAFVNAGRNLSEIKSLNGLVSFPFLVSLAILGVLPLVLKKLIEFLRARKFLKTFPKPRKFDYNAIVIGAGAAGLVSAYIGQVLKAKVAMIEKAQPGGDCLNFGCVPSKSLLHLGQLVHGMRQANSLGLIKSSERVEPIDFQVVKKTIRKAIQDIEPHDSFQRYRSLNVDCYSGTAQVISPYEVSVGGKTLSTKNIILATGASPITPAWPGISNVKSVTSETIWDLESLPKKLLVCGGGPIGCEMAQAFQRLGSQVTLIERNKSILQQGDPKASALLAEKLRSEGVNLLLETTAQEFKSASELLVSQQNGSTVTIDFDVVLFALGRKPRTQGFGLENLGLEYNPNGTLKVNAYLQTKYQNIYACGDLAGPYQLTHVCAHQAWYAAVNSLLGVFKKFAADYRVIPQVTYTDPEIASVGRTEAELTKEEIAFDVTVYHMSDLDRAITDLCAEGFVKVFTKKDSDQILGAVVAHKRASEILQEITFAMKWNLGLGKIMATIHPYPTYSEANKMLAGQWRQKRQPTRALKLLERYFRWQRGSSDSDLLG